MSANPPEQLIRQVVRGEKPIESLGTLGVQISHVAGVCRIDGSGTTVAKPSLEDVAVGIINCARSDASQCREWAAVILAASAVIDLACLEASEEGASLLEVLWDAAQSGVIKARDVTLARTLAPASST